MQRSTAISRPRTLCQICEAISSQRTQSVKVRPLLAGGRNVSLQRSRHSRRAMSPFMSPLSRALSSSAFPQAKQDTVQTEADHGAAPRLHPSSVADIMGYLRTSVSKVRDHRGIPSEETVSSALEVCDMLANWFTDEAVRPQIAHAISEMDSTASSLLSLDGDKAGAAAPSAGQATAISHAAEGSSPLPGAIEYSGKLRLLIDKISEAAYLIVAHPPVFITPKLLKQYVRVQAKLEKPETLPRIFQLYASKPLPREGSGRLSYTKQNPNRAANAISAEVVEAALDAAIATKHLDAAVGIVEAGYASPAFQRNKFIRVALLPLTGIAATPLAAYALATSFSAMQEQMDSATATTVAFAGITAYVSFTAIIGGVALTTANDQMRRVTWAPGVALRKRWIREEERAALDKIACAWGFQEEGRRGEEEGGEWEGLREFINHRGMVLDRVELMEGMQ
ncbi:hypothetical protein F4777DRAFT_389007 [Nemania sp. FL0916]|nr:hypothetical protein F4777DRAFT_389007 [Nemania sp. FL0916]